MPSFPSGANWTQSGFLSRRDRPARRFGRSVGAEGGLGLGLAPVILGVFEGTDPGLFGTMGLLGKSTGGGEESVLRLENDLSVQGWGNMS